MTDERKSDFRSTLKEIVDYKNSIAPGNNSNSNEQFIPYQINTPFISMNQLKIPVNKSIS